MEALPNQLRESTAPRGARWQRCRLSPPRLPASNQQSHAGRYAAARSRDLIWPRPACRLEPGTEVLGIHHFARAGIAGRGVLIDIARFLESSGQPINHAGVQVVPIELVESARLAQGMDIHASAIVLLRFRWLHPAPRRARGLWRSNVIRVCSSRTTRLLGCGTTALV